MNDQEVFNCYRTNPFHLVQCKLDKCPKYDSCILYAQHEREINNPKEEDFLKYAEAINENFGYDTWVDVKQIAARLEEPEFIVYEKLQVIVRKKWFYVQKKVRERYFKRIDFRQTPFYKSTQKIIAKQVSEGVYEV